jgi:hypothetical protein
MIRAKVLAGIVTGGVVMVGVMGCQQAPAPAPTVVVEHHDDGHDRDHHPPPPPPAQRPQDQRDPNHRDAPPPRQPE